MSSNTQSKMLYSCSRCCRFFDSYDILLMHYFWKHGTESRACPQCRLRTWDSLMHRCHYLPGLQNTMTEPLFVVELNNDSLSLSSKYRESLYCYCGKDKEGSFMIGCDGDKCQLKWYHYECVGIIIAPVGKWYCPECEVKYYVNKTRGATKVSS